MPENYSEESNGSCVPVLQRIKNGTIGLYAVEKIKLDENGQLLYEIIQKNLGGRLPLLKELKTFREYKTTRIHVNKLIESYLVADPTIVEIKKVFGRKLPEKIRRAVDPNLPDYNLKKNVDPRNTRYPRILIALLEKEGVPVYQSIFC